MKEVQVNSPHEWKSYCTNITNHIFTVFYVPGRVLTGLSWPVVDDRIQQQQLVHFDEEAIEDHVAAKVQSSPFDRVFVSEFVQDENGGSDGLPAHHGHELIQEFILDRLNERR